MIEERQSTFHHKEAAYKPIKHFFNLKMTGSSGQTLFTMRPKIKRCTLQSMAEMEVADLLYLVNAALAHVLM